MSTNLGYNAHGGPEAANESLRLPRTVCSSFDAPFSEQDDFIANPHTIVRQLVDVSRSRTMAGLAVKMHDANGQGQSHARTKLDSRTRSLLEGELWRKQKICTIALLYCFPWRAPLLPNLYAMGCALIR
jgi:hypothetical protein